MAYTGQLFGKPQRPEEPTETTNLEWMVRLQTMELRLRFGTDCLDATQLKSVLNVGESNVYEWLKKCPQTRTIGRRKVVPIVWVAYYLVYGGEKNGKA